MITKLFFVFVATHNVYVFIFLMCMLLYFSPVCCSTHDIGIQMKRKELTETFMMILNCTDTFGGHGFYKAISAL